MAYTITKTLIAAVCLWAACAWTDAYAGTGEDTAGLSGPDESAGAGFTTIGGPLPKLVRAGAPYLVMSDIEVPPGRVVTIEPGVVFLFKNFTGLHVQGQLKAEGTEEKPIVFTSEFDRTYNPACSLLPNPYDWNGLYLHSDAIGTHLAKCRILYSVYGIISDTKFIRITACTFNDNGKTNVILEGVTQPVEDQTPYFYALSVKDATVDGVPVRILIDPLVVRRSVVRYSGVTAVLGGCGLGIASTLRWIQSQRALDDISTTDPENLTTYTSTDWENAQGERDKNRALTLVGYLVGIVGAAGFGFSFRF